MWKVTFHEMQKMQKSCDHRLTKMEQDDDDEDDDDDYRVSRDTFRIQGILLFLVFVDNFCLEGILSFLLFPDTLRI